MNMTGDTKIVTVKADFNNCSKKLNLYQLEEYKKSFQNFWVTFMEQFVPATTIFVFGEKWCIREKDICEPNICDYELSVTSTDLETEVITDDSKPDDISTGPSSSDYIEVPTGDLIGPDEENGNSGNYGDTGDTIITLPRLKASIIPTEEGETSIPIPQPNPRNSFNVNKEVIKITLP